jgi:quercetin dioxygenase-like cupin family protein
MPDAHNNEANLIESSKNSSTFECGAFIDLNSDMDWRHLDPSSKEDAGHNTKMLVKYPEFRIVLITMRALSRWDDHKTSARIFINVLRGHIQFHTPNGMFDVRPGQLLALDPGIVHSVDAPEESAFLLTLSDPR